MAEPVPNRFVAWLKELERRGDAWAATKLSPEEFEEATQLDKAIKADWARWLGWYAAGIVITTLGLMLIKGQADWLRAFLTANLLGFCALVFFLSSWYGYRKWTGERARRHFAVFIGSMAIGGIVMLGLDMVVHGRSIFDLAPQKYSTLAGSVLLMGFVAFALMSSIANLRTREHAQRLALLKAEAERERLERQSTQAELKLLQAQVEPHFLFNTLANVRHLVHTGSPDALAMLDHLIHYLRSSLPEIRSEGSTLGREGELARAYLEILRLRMGGALEIEVDVPRELAHAPFPPLMVMTLVENAIKHGVAPQGKGHVSVKASAGEGRLRVTVEDDGRGLAGTIGRGVGLANVRERLAALFGAGARLELEGREGGGTRAVIEVPDR